jgi:ferredoxin
MAGAAVLTLPPLAVLFQVTGDVDFCGRWCPRMFLVWQKGETLSAYLLGWLRAFMGVALVAAILAVTYRFGRHWCSHVCPVGGVLELAGRLVPRFAKIDFGPIPAVPFRYAYLAAFFVLPALGVGSLCCSYCNFAALPRLVGAPFSQADLAYFLRIQGVVNLGLLLALGVFAKGGRAYCNLLCPIGALDALVNRLGVRSGRRVRIDGDRCTECGACTDVCPTAAIAAHSKPAVDQLACMPCRLCERACPVGAISYGTRSS